MILLIKRVIFFAIALIVVMGGIIYFQHQRILKLKSEKLSAENLNMALNDSITYYQNKNNEWIAEKLTIQTTIKNFEKIYRMLTDAQKELFVRIII